MAVVAAAVACAAATFTALAGVAQAQTCPWVGSSQPTAQRVAEVMSLMTLDQDDDYLVEGLAPLSAECPNPSSEPVCVLHAGHQLVWVDPRRSARRMGPAGVADGLPGVTQLPAGVGFAATFDPSLAQQYGQVIG